MQRSLRALAQTTARRAAGRPLAAPPSGRPVPPKQPMGPETDRSKTIVDSFRSLSPNQRILLGLAFGAVGVAGLAWDRTLEEADGTLAKLEGEEVAEGKKPWVNVQVVSRDKS